MAVGDVVNGISAVSAAIIFQPAVGVEVMITSCGINDILSNYVVMFNGSQNSYYTTLNGFATCKICITNTNYLRIALFAANFMSYSGIQIK